jgi:uracil-DNA glycosylase
MVNDGPNSKIESLRREAAYCQACPLWKDATQTVFGESPQDSEIMVVGEQPGDQEDREGRPFVGPAGLILDKALREAAWTATPLSISSLSRGENDGFTNVRTPTRSRYAGVDYSRRSRR